MQHIYRLFLIPLLLMGGLEASDLEREQRLKDQIIDAHRRHRVCS